MKKLLWACLLALPCLAWPAQAKAFTLGKCQIDLGAKAWFNVRYAGHGFSCGLPQAGPWYLYWPMEAHFQVPAPDGARFFAPPMTLPPNFHRPAPPTVQPAAYQPGYWYGQ